MTQRYLALYGRSPHLAHLELLAVAPRFDITLIPSGEESFGLFDATDDFTHEHAESLQQTLGGTVRIVKIMAECLRDQLMPVSAEVALAHAVADGKLTIGISMLSLSGNPTSPQKFSMPFKTILKESGRSVRLVTPAVPHATLGGGTLLHNRLATGSNKHFELFIFQKGVKCLVGITATVQDIEDYGHRDFGIPRPDAVSGMLPPKLAQTMVNLGIDGKTRLAVYDPFCGNGRVLLEATLQEIEIFGSDLREIQVEASKENLAWLSQEYDLPYVTDNHLWVADAAKGPGRKIGQPFVIVSEPYLGKPLRSRLGLGEHKSWLDDLVPLYTAFIEYWAQSLEQPEKMIVIFPRTTAVDGREISVFDTVVDRLHQVGYSAEVLFCYSRPDSIVERDIVKIKKSQHY